MPTHRGLGQAPIAEAGRGRSYRRVTLTEEILEEAQARARQLPIHKNSHREHAANEVGCIGEVLFERFLGIAGIEFRDQLTSTRHDFIVNGDMTVDVKTKDRTVLPKRHYENSVPLYNHEHQRPDYSFIVSLLRDKSAPSNDIRRFTHGCLVGGLDFETLERIGKRWETGETDPANGTKFWTACINVRMEQLLTFQEMLRVFSCERRT